MKKPKDAPNAARLVASSLLGLDYVVAIVAKKRYVINPPTIAKLAGAAFHFSHIEDAETIPEMLAAINIKHAAAALSWLIDGSEQLTEELSQGTLREVTEAIAQAYTLLDLQDFTVLSTLAKNVTRLTAKAK